MNNQTIREHAVEFRRLLRGKLRAIPGLGVLADSGGKELLLYFAKGLLSAVFAFFLGSSEMAFHSFPAGIAFLCASEKYCFFALAGNIAAALWRFKGFEIAAVVTLCCLFIVRMWISYNSSDKTRASVWFCEPIAARTVIATAGVFIVSLCALFADGLSFFGLASMLFSCIATAVFTFILCGSSSAVDILPVHKSCSKLLIAFLLVFAAAKYSFFGFSLGLFAAAVTVLIFADRHDLLPSSACGLLCGLACDVVYAPMLCIAAFVFRAVKKYYPKFALPVSLLCVSAYSLWVLGSNAVISVFPDVAVAAVVFVAYTRLSVHTGNSEQGTDKNAFETVPVRDGDEMLINSLGELSRVLHALTDKLRRPTYGDVYGICRDVCSKHCSHCHKCEECYGDGGGGDDLIGALSSASLLRGKVLTDDFIPVGYGISCIRADAIISDINTEMGSLRRELAKNDASNAYAVCFDSISVLLREAKDNSDEENRLDPVLSGKICALLRRQGFRFDCAAVYGSRRAQLIITGVSELNLRAEAQKLRSILFDSLGVKLSEPVIGTNGCVVKLTFEAAPRFMCESFSSCVAKSGEDVCGDTALTFSDSGFFYSVISDGTGSGRDAAVTSRLCCAFAEQLSRCGGKLPTVLSTINNFVLGQNFECGASVDLFRFDTFSGEAHFIKSGAAPSFVLRGENVFRVTAATVPVGMTYTLNTEEIVMPMRAGDIIVMASDGVYSGANDGDGMNIAAFAAASSSEIPQILARKILDEVAKRSLSDDLSVSVIRISEAV